jgi:hypothetical protein
MNTVKSVAQSKNNDDVATLYKDSVIIKNARILIATFNSAENSYGGSRFDYNWENCNTAATFFKSQISARTNFWCEKGFYKE